MVDLQDHLAKTARNAGAHVNVNAVKAASVSPDAVNRESPSLKLLRNLVVLMEEPLASDLLIADLRAVLIEELPVLDLHHMVDLHKEDLIITKKVALRKMKLVTCPHQNITLLIMKS